MRRTRESWLGCSSEGQWSLVVGWGPALSKMTEESHGSLSLSFCCQEDTDTPADVPQFPTEEGLRRKWMRILSSKASRPISSQKQRAGCCQSIRGIRTLHPEESTALREYYQRKTRHVKELQRTSPPGHQTQAGGRESSQKPTGVPPDCCVPQRFITTLKLKSFAEQLKQAAEADVHDPTRCSACVDQQARLALYNFLRATRTQLESQQLQIKLDTHLSENNLISLVGELSRSLPKASDEPGSILRTLAKKKFDR